MWTINKRKKKQESKEDEEEQNTHNVRKQGRKEGRSKIPLYRVAGPQCAANRIYPGCFLARFTAALFRLRPGCAPSHTSELARRGEGLGWTGGAYKGMLGMQTVLAVMKAMALRPPTWTPHHRHSRKFQKHTETKKNPAIKNEKCKCRRRKQWDERHDRAPGLRGRARRPMAQPRPPPPASPYQQPDMFGAR